MSSEPADGADGQLFDEEEVYEGHSQLRAIFGHDLQTVFDIIAGRVAHNVAQEDYLEYNEANKAANTETEEGKISELSTTEKIAACDEPERLQPRLARRPNPVSDSMLAQEAAWITEELKAKAARSSLVDFVTDNPKEPRGLFDSFLLTDLFNERRQRERYNECFKRSGNDPEDEKYEEKQSGEVFFPKDKTIEQDVREKVLECLKMLINERVDVPFICVHRAHILFPPLSVDVVWLIWDLDEVFWHLAEIRESLLNSCLEDGADDPRLIDSIREANDEIALRDYQTFEQSRKHVEPVTSPAGGKRRRTQLTPEQMFNRYFTDTGVRSHWFDRLVKPADLVAAITDDMDMDCEISGSQQQLRQAPPPPDLDNSTPLSIDQCRSKMNDWICSLIASKSGEKLVIGDNDIADMVIRFEGKQFALNPDIRGVVRQAYYKDAAITTLTTMRGEKMIDPGSPEWLATRLMNKPISQLWTPTNTNNSSRGLQDHNAFTSNCPWESRYLKLESVIEANVHRELGILIDQCEADKLINVVIHPLSCVDDVPWDVTKDSGKYVIERERWERDDSEYPHERERLSFTHKQDLLKTEEYVTKFTNVLNVSSRDTPWKWFLYRILEHAIFHELIPIFRKEVRAKILSESQFYVNLVCKFRLQLQLSAKPLQYNLIPNVEDPSLFPDFAAIARAEVDDMVDVLVENSSMPPPSVTNDEELGTVVSAPLVYALVLDPDGDATKSNPVHLIMANREGLLIKTNTYPKLLEYVLGEGDVTRPRDFEMVLLSLRTRPNAIVIPLINPIAVELYNYLKNLAECRLRHTKHRWQVLVVPAPVSLLAANKITSKGGSGGSPQPMHTLIGLSSIHYVVDPIYEVAGLWDDGESNPLLSLPLHYLQHKVPNDLRNATLQEILVRAINTIGVFPNRLRVLGYLAPALKFVSGLGTVKSANIMKALQQPMSARETLLGLENRSSNREGSSGEAVLGPHVFLSCASFLRLQSTDDIFNDRYAELDPLDDTRIHPIDEYTTARKMCRDAQDEDGEGGGGGGGGNDGKPHNLEETLEDLDLEAYAYILGEGGRPRMLPHLEWLKWEMIKPFKDPRIPIQGLPLSYVLRSLIADETKCRPTANLQLVVETVNPSIQLMVLPSNTYGRVIDVVSGLTKSQIIRARLERLVYNELTSQCVATSKGISNVFDNSGPHLTHDVHTLSPLIYEDIELARANRGRRVQPAAPAPSRHSGGGNSSSAQGNLRSIRHPCMSNLNHCDLIRQLSSMSDKNAPVGSVCKFRIGQQKDNLILYMLVNHKPFRFKAIPIEERNPDGDTPPQGEVARELHIQGIGTFSSLNEIIARPCSSFQTFVRDVTRHEKFQASTSLDELCAALPLPADNKAQWAIILDPQGNDPHRFQERFLLVTMAVSSRTGAKRILKDPLVVSPLGFRIWSEKSSSLQHILNWYKNKGYPNRESFRAKYEKERS